MKLLTHNILACHIKGIQNNYPFIIEAVQIETKDADFNPGAPCIMGLHAPENAGPQVPLTPSSPSDFSRRLP